MLFLWKKSYETNIGSQVPQGSTKFISLITSTDFYLLFRIIVIIST